MGLGFEIFKIDPSFPELFNQTVVSIDQSEADYSLTNSAYLAQK